MQIIAVVEPWLIPIGFAIKARELGAEILTGQKVMSLSQQSFEGKNQWTIFTRPTPESEVCSSGRSAPGTILVTSREKHVCEQNDCTDSWKQCFTVSTIVNCAGAAHNLSDHCCLLILIVN